MRLADDVKNDIKAAKNIRLPWWILLCLGIGSLPIYWLFDHFGNLNIALPALNSILVLGFMLVLKRCLWPHAWFWITMAILAALHVPLVLLVPWTSKWVPAIAIAVLDSADLIAMLAVLAVVGKFVEEPEAPGR